MPFLTSDIIRENPWNVLTHDLPALPSRLLLAAACRAADYCHTSEFFFAVDRRAGPSFPPAWGIIEDDPAAPGERDPDSRAAAAGRRLKEIYATFELLFGRTWE